MKKCFTLILFIGWHTFIYADNYIVLNDQLSIEMPGTYPDTFSRGKLNGYATYWYRIYYEALSKKDKNIPKNATAGDLERYYDRFMKEWVSEMKGELKESSLFSQNGLAGREVIFEAKNSADLPQLWFSRIIVVEDVVYLFSINAAKGNRESLEKSSADYFSSLFTMEDMMIKQQEKEYNKLESKKNEVYRRRKDALNNELDLHKQHRLASQITWMAVITLLTILFFAAAIGLFFLIRHFYKKYD